MSEIPSQTTALDAILASYDALVKTHCDFVCRQPVEIALAEQRGWREAMMQIREKSMYCSSLAELLDEMQGLNERRAKLDLTGAVENLGKVVAGI